MRPLAPPEVGTSSNAKEADSVGALRDEQGITDGQLLQTVATLIHEVQVNFVVQKINEVVCTYDTRNFLSTGCPYRPFGFVRQILFSKQSSVLRPAQTAGGQAQLTVPFCARFYFLEATVGCTTRPSLPLNHQTLFSLLCVPSFETVVPLRFFKLKIVPCYPRILDLTARQSNDQLP